MADGVGKMLAQNPSGSVKPLLSGAQVLALALVAWVLLAALVSELVPSVFAQARKPRTNGRGASFRSLSFMSPTVGNPAPADWAEIDKK
jgi:hypothetical protein